MALLEMRHITKRFGEVTANENVNFIVEKGQIHALLGENGAGKSTLMNILYGLYTPTEGEILFNGKPIHIKSPRHAIELGIGMVHQHFMLIPALSVIENVVLGMKENKTVLDLKAAAVRFEEMARKYGMPMDPWCRVEQLSIGQQQRLEILKALFRKADLLILDEPTAVLTPQEVESLFVMMRRLKEDGCTLIFISHKLGEILDICDCCTVLRQGRVAAANLPLSQVEDKKEMAALMVGKEVDLVTQKREAQTGQTVLKVEELEYVDDRKVKKLQDISFEVKAGEILGVCGVDGNGQSELIACIAGLKRPAGGRVHIKGEECTGLSPKKILGKGVSHIPEDRHKFGMVKTLSVSENLILMSYDKEEFSKGGFLKRKKIREHSEALCNRYEVKRGSIEDFAGTLSGGNQQKFVVGRELDREPELLIAVHPDRGLDIGATKYIQSRIVQERDRGAAVVLVSTELEEIMELSDRILVLCEGKIMGILNQKDATRERLGLLMAGETA